MTVRLADTPGQAVYGSPLVPMRTLFSVAATVEEPTLWNLKNMYDVPVGAVARCTHCRSGWHASRNQIQLPTGTQ